MTLKSSFKKKKKRIVLKIGQQFQFLLTTKSKSTKIFIEAFATNTILRTRKKYSINNQAIYFIKCRVKVLTVKKKRKNKIKIYKRKLVRKQKIKRLKYQ